MFRNIKKWFTLIELIIATIVISFIYVLILHNYWEQNKEINMFKERVESTSLWQQGYNVIEYLFLSRIIKLEKENKENIIKDITDKNTNSNNFLNSWVNKWLWLFFIGSNEIPPNNIPNNSYWTLKSNVNNNWKNTWAFIKINGQNDTDHMNTIWKFSFIDFWESRVGPFYYVNIKKKDTGIKKGWNEIYSLSFIEHFVYQNANWKDYTFTFNINPME